MKRTVLKYGISTLVCGLMAGLIAFIRNIGAEPLVERYRILCDAFTVPGLLFILVGLLLALSNEGSLDGIGYAAKYAARAFVPGGRLRMEKYADYVQNRRERKVSGYGFLFVVGGVCMALALAFLWLFYL